jgi:hypothetical protein
VLLPGVNVVGRPDARSSVIKRKAVRAPGAEDHEEPSTDPWCDCGWPYTLLLPSGASTPEGTPFTLAVALTDYAGKSQEPRHVQLTFDLFVCSLPAHKAAPQSGQVVRRPTGRLGCPSVAQSIPFGSLATRLKGSRWPYVVLAWRQSSVLIAALVRPSGTIVAIPLVRLYVAGKSLT